MKCDMFAEKAVEVLVPKRKEAGEGLEKVSPSKAEETEKSLAEGVPAEGILSKTRYFQCPCLLIQDMMNMPYLPAWSQLAQRQMMQYEAGFTIW